MGTILFLCAYSFLLTFLCTGSSPFINYMGIDSSVFFTIGRGMVAGKVPYLDLFDHKGLYLYFINYLGALLSSDTSIGIFFVECCFMCINSILFYKIVKTFIRDTFKCVVSVMLIVGITLNYLNHEGGNNTEFYSLTFQLIAFFLVTRYYQSEQVKHSPVLMFIHGICVGVVLFLRANMVAMWGAVAIVIGWRLFSHKEYKNFVANIFAGLMGLIVGLAPPIVYMIFTGSLNAMIDSYISFNMLYIGKESLFTRILHTYADYTGIMMLFLTFLMTLSVIIFCKSNNKRSMKVMFVLAYVLSLLSVFVAGRNAAHYFEPLMLYLIPLVVYSVERAQINCTYKKLGAICVIFVLTVGLNGRTPTRLFINARSKDYVRFAEKAGKIWGAMKHQTGAVLSTGDWPTALLYTKMNVIPSERYFYHPMISYDIYPYAVDAHVYSILNDENDVVIANYAGQSQKDNGLLLSNTPRNNEVISHLAKNYDLILEDYERQMWVRKRKD